MAERKIDGDIQQWLAGDELAFKKILDYYYRRLLASSLKSVSNREDAEELVMNALLKIWQHKHRLSEVQQFDDYLFGILRRETAALSRKQVLETENIDDLSLSELGSTDHPEFTIKDIQSLYRTALDKLTPKQREVFLSIREQDMSRKEIAEKNGMSIHTVNNHMNAALKVLRQEMKEYPDALIGILLATSVTNINLILPNLA
ncbi:sigma-70 family RNA polymerase sigma factor [Parapedobacter tibetensis]|uniref:sigma-70 family RNA polymerase sigma factor n=1 Tax=Parapedobacter tibetensis TaxID=2972951 RepID=UPI00214D862D|nr:sigma-70 family RNA polymerase sigma factor [Parapedobacter tibetensis]